MEKLKSSGPLDRLSELPDSLIFGIFEFLLMTDVVRTAVLSRRWRNLWNKTPNLNFDNSQIDFHRDKFRNFVNRALLRWRGTRVLKFKVSCSGDDYGENSLVADVDSWLRFAIDNGVEELHISYYRYGVPQFVYSCSSLKKLSLDYCKLRINGNVEWKQLKSLTIFLGLGVTQHVIDQILSGSPLLEVLSLTLVQKDENLNMCFRSSSLKELSINNCTLYYKELRIWIPNIATLTILGSYSKILLENVSSLTHAILGLSEGHWNDFTEFPLHDILPSIQQVESITLLDWHSKMIGPKSTCRLPNVKFVKLNSVKEYEDMVRLLEIFPNIKTLVLQNKTYGINNAISGHEFKPDDPSGPFVTELATVEVTWNGVDFSIFPLIV